MPRGRLIFPFLASIARIDTEATEADPDGAGPLTSGYDPIFREPIKIPDLTDPSQPQMTDARREHTVIQVPCQIEPDQWELLDLMSAGRSPDTIFQVVFHYRTLERMGLVESNGEPHIRIDDRLTVISDRLGNLIRQLRPPGIYVTEVQDIGHGLGRFRNLLLVKFQDRKQAQG